MNASTIVHYGNRTLMKELEGLRDDEWNVVGVTTSWSLRDLLAHLTSYEVLLADIVRAVLGEGPTPTLDHLRSGGPFNDEEIAARAGRTVPELMAEYQTAHGAVMEGLARLSPERLRETGTLPWYGADYSLEDFIVYANYGHKREHAAQIKLFRRAHAGAKS